MTSGGEGQWTLRVGTHESGPFTLEEVRGLFQDGEILGHHHATSPKLGGRWVEIRTLFPEIAGAQTQIPTSPPPMAPSRPAGDVGSALNLLEALQSAKDKRAAANPPTPAKIRVPGQSDGLKVLAHLGKSRWVQIALAIFCLGMIAHLILSRFRAPETPKQAEVQAPPARIAPPPTPVSKPSFSFQPPTVKPAVPITPKPAITVSVPGQAPRTLPVEQTNPRFRGKPRAAPAVVPPKFAIDPNTLIPGGELVNPTDGRPIHDPTSGSSGNFDADDRDENGNYRGLIDPSPSPPLTGETGGT